jgi:hypothetical protein
MTAPRLLGVALLLLCACFENRALEVRTISLDHLTAGQAAELVTPYLSKDGSVFHSKEMLNAITIRDHSRNVDRIRSMISVRDASPANVALHFQLIRATPGGEVGPGLDRIAEALGELLRFNGYQLMSEALVSASERGVVEQTLDGGGMPLQLGVRINDLRGSDNNGSAELAVELRRPSGGSVLVTNVVVPMGQTVVLGSAYPGSDGNALILTVRGEMGSQRLRSARGRRPDREGDHADHADAVEAAAAAVEAANAAVEEANARAAAVHGDLIPTPATDVRIRVEAAKTVPGRKTIVPAAKAPATRAVPASTPPPAAG